MEVCCITDFMINEAVSLGINGKLISPKLNALTTQVESALRKLDGRGGLTLPKIAICLLMADKARAILEKGKEATLREKEEFADSLFTTEKITPKEKLEILAIPIALGAEKPQLIIALTTDTKNYDSWLSIEDDSLVKPLLDCLRFFIDCLQTHSSESIDLIIDLLTLKSRKKGRGVYQNIYHKKILFNTIFFSLLGRLIENGRASNVIEILGQKIAHTHWTHWNVTKKYYLTEPITNQSCFDVIHRSALGFKTLKRADVEFLKMYVDIIEKILQLDEGHIYIYSIIKLIKKNSDTWPYKKTCIYDIKSSGVSESQFAKSEKIEVCQILSTIGFGAFGRMFDACNATLDNYENLDNKLRIAIKKTTRHMELLMKKEEEISTINASINEGEIQENMGKLDTLYSNLSDIKRGAKNFRVNEKLLLRKFKEIENQLLYTKIKLYILDLKNSINLYASNDSSIEGLEKVLPIFEAIKAALDKMHDTIKYYDATEEEVFTALHFKSAKNPNYIKFLMQHAPGIIKKPLLAIIKKERELVDYEKRYMESILGILLNLGSEKKLVSEDRVSREFACFIMENPDPISDLIVRRAHFGGIDTLKEIRRRLKVIFRRYKLTTIFSEPKLILCLNEEIKKSESQGIVKTKDVRKEDGDFEFKL